MSMSAEQLKQRDAMQRLTDFLNEVGMLRHTPRSGYKFLGSGRETVAEHSHRTAVIGYALAQKTGADAARTVMLCLFHDLPEARTGDFNYVNRLYDTSRERDALEDAVDDFFAVIRAEQLKKSVQSKFIDEVIENA